MLAGQESVGRAFREVQADKAIRKARSSNIRVQGRRMKMGESVCFWRLGDSGWRGPGRVVAIKDYILTVKISNQKYDCRHEDCISVGTEFTKLKANWAEIAEQEEDHPIRVMTRLASKKKAQSADQEGAERGTAAEESEKDTTVGSTVTEEHDHAADNAGEVESSNITEEAGEV
jgi:hypothetical protein